MKNSIEEIKEIIQLYGYKKICYSSEKDGILGTGILFSCYNLAVSRNPEEVETLFNATLMGFALMETFIFLSFIVGYLVYLT